MVIIFFAGRKLDSSSSAHASSSSSSSDTYTGGSLSFFNRKFNNGVPINRLCDICKAASIPREASPNPSDKMPLIPVTDGARNQHLKLDVNKGELIVEPKLLI